MKRLPDKAHLSIRETAEYFGVNERTIRREIDDGNLEAIKMRRQWRIPRAAILEYESCNSRFSTL